MPKNNGVFYTITPKGNRFPGIKASIDEITQNDILAMAWLAEMASVGCDLRGMHRWAEQLRADASRLRSTAVDQ